LQFRRGVPIFEKKECAWDRLTIASEMNEEVVIFGKDL
jgi:hypothetical protein